MRKIFASWTSGCWPEARKSIAFDQCSVWNDADILSHVVTTDELKHFSVTQKQSSNQWNGDTLVLQIPRNAAGKIAATVFLRVIFWIKVEETIRRYWPLSEKKLWRQDGEGCIEKVFCFLRAIILQKNSIPSFELREHSS